MSQPVSEEEFASILKQVRRFVDEELIPLEPALLGQGFKATLPQLKEKRQKVRELGMWTPQIPVKFGGLGLSVAQFGRVSEQLARTPIGHYCFNCQAPDAGNMEILMEFGTPAQHEQFLKPLLAGDVRSCFGMTEPEHAGSNPVYMSTTAVRDGDEYVINGHKWFTSGADGAAFAIVMAVTDPDTENRYGKMSQILVPLDSPGYELVRNVPIMGEAGDDWLTHGEVRFTDVRVPQSNVLGGEGQGFAIAQERLGPGRIHHCMRWIGISERALAMMCERAASRELSPGQPLATRQVIQHWIAESRAGIHASRLMVLDAAAKIDSVGAREARQEISMIKFFVAEHMLKILDRAIQVHGALGMTEDTPLSFWYRHERASRIYDGADEVHKTVVARYELQPHGIKVRL
ncbi:MAG: acyl-CoA dehydrogenase family protein [Anaerolineales bacterium]|nr:acyl-CoA dehydrogenase family protein [Anaerolineales bacterium]